MSHNALPLAVPSNLTTTSKLVTLSTPILPTEQVAHFLLEGKGSHVFLIDGEQIIMGTTNALMDSNAQQEM